MLTSLNNKLWAIDDYALTDIIHQATYIAEKMSFKDMKKLIAGYGDKYGEDSSPAEPSKKPYQMKGNVAEIKMYGPMSKRLSWLSMFFGGCSTVEVASAITEALADPAVSSILLCIDSPGGNVDGTSELAHAVKEATDTKPVWAFVDGMACSAACWVMSQADKIYSTEVSMHANIGVLTALVDQSEAIKESKVKIHKIATGPLKGIGSYFSPITKEQIASVQAQVDEIGAIMVGEINSSRDTKYVLGEGMADGGSVLAKAAKEAKLIDGVSSYASVIANMQTMPTNNSGSTAQFDNPSLSGENKEVRMTDDIKAAERENGFKAMLVKFGIMKAEDAPAIPAEALTPAEPVEDPKVALLDEIAALTAKLSDMDTKLVAALATIEANIALVEDGRTARADAIKAFSEESNRVLGPGTVTVEAATEKLAGFSLAKINAETQPYLKVANTQTFAANPSDPDATGQQSRGAEDTGEAELAEAVKEKNKIRAAEIAHNLLQSGMYLSTPV